MVFPQAAVNAVYREEDVLLGQVVAPEDFLFLHGLDLLHEQMDVLVSCVGTAAKMCLVVSFCRVLRKMVNCHHEAMKHFVRSFDLCTRIIRHL